jgi:peptidoglycan hydrolase CwlO-like protein
MKKNLSVILALFIFGYSAVYAFAQTVPSATPTPTPSTAPSGSVTPAPTTDDSSGDSSTVGQLSQEISNLQQKVSDLKSQGDTLSSQIGVMDNQIQLTQYKINATQGQIMSLTMDIDTAGKRMSTLEDSLTNVTKVMLSHIVATYQAGSASDMTVLLGSSDISDFVTKTNYLRFVQQHDQQLLYDTQQARVDYANQKDILEGQKKQVLALNTQLQSYTQDLASQKSAKQDLLTQTQGDEQTYSAMLAQAQAELAGFSRFTSGAGGSSLLSGQTSCDSWGCYYNQRDSQWGDLLINGQDGYTMAGYGCLITSLAMVSSHMGHNVSPADIAASGGDNFAVNTAMLAKTITVDGVSITRNSISSLDSALQSGPVIVGIYAYGGTHFVVLKSGSNGNYVMDDPYIPNGHDINFTDHYSVSSIFEMDQVSVN